MAGPDLTPTGFLRPATTDAFGRDDDVVVEDGLRVVDDDAACLEFGPLVSGTSAFVVRVQHEGLEEHVLAGTKVEPLERHRLRAGRELAAPRVEAVAEPGADG